MQRRLYLLFLVFTALVLPSYVHPAPRIIVERPSSGRLATLAAEEDGITCEKLRRFVAQSATDNLFNWRIENDVPLKCVFRDATVNFPNATWFRIYALELGAEAADEIYRLFSNPDNPEIIRQYAWTTVTHSLPNNDYYRFGVCETAGFSGYRIFLLTTDTCDYGLLGPIVINDADPCPPIGTALPALDPWGLALLAVLLLFSGLLYMRLRKA